MERQRGMCAGEEMLFREMLPRLVAPPSQWLSWGAWPANARTKRPRDRITQVTY